MQDVVCGFTHMDQNGSAMSEKALQPDNAQPKRGAPKGGKGFVFNARITGETRAALEAEAERTGRSLSQVAELAIERGLREDQAFGGPEISSILRAVGAWAARSIPQDSQLATDLYLRGRILGAASAIIAQELARIARAAPENPEVADIRKKCVEFWCAHAPAGSPPTVRAAENFINKIRKELVSKATDDEDFYNLTNCPKSYAIKYARECGIEVPAFATELADLLDEFEVTIRTVNDDGDLPFQLGHEDGRREIEGDHDWP